MRTIKDKFVEMCYLISSDNGEYGFWWDYMDSKDIDYKILNEKMKNLIKLLNDDDKFLLDKDIENEIWEII